MLELGFRSVEAYRIELRVAVSGAMARIMYTSIGVPVLFCSNQMFIFTYVFGEMDGWF